jgi:hypothetical protein
MDLHALKICRPQEEDNNHLKQIIIKGSTIDQNLDIASVL